MRYSKAIVFFVLILVQTAVLAQEEEGVASYYADSLHGELTASELPYDKDAMTAAHRTLSFGTKVKITNLDNDKSTEVTINDRGPYAENRIIDVSGAAAKELGLLDSGTARVRIEVLEG